MSSSSTSPLTIFLLPMDSTGHIYPVIGLGQALAQRGHTVKLLINDVLAKQFSTFGFELIILKRSTVVLDESGAAKSPSKANAEDLLANGVISQLTPLEKLRRPTDPMSFRRRHFDANRDYQDQIEAAIKAGKPDLLILDQYILPTAVLQSRLPYVAIHSANPLELYDSELLPPAGAGFPVDSDPNTWIEFRQLANTKIKQPRIAFQQQLNDLFGYDPASDPTAHSRRLNLYMYPAELDYTDRGVPAPPNSLRVDALCPIAPVPFVLPEALLNRRPNERLIYLSLGSMCSVDVQLMKKILAALGKLPHKCIISKGPKAEQFDLPPNCWGEAFLPQTSILPLVDLVISHGGNNTLTETFTFGKPLILMAFFGDQYDNAQRVAEKGYGVRLAPYEFTEKQLIEAIEGVLADGEMGRRVEEAAKRIARDQSKIRACEKIEQFVMSFGGRSEM